MQIRKFRSPPKGNSSNSTIDDGLATNQLNFRPYQPHSEYAKDISGLCDSASIQQQIDKDNKLSDLSNIIIKKFPSHKEYVGSMSGLCDSGSIDALAENTDIQPDDTSLPDIEAELKRRNIISRSFESLSSGSSEQGLKELNAMDAELKKFLATEDNQSVNSSSDELENDMKKMGINWASTMLKKMKKTDALSSSTSSSSFEKLKSSRKTRPKNATNSFLDSKLIATEAEQSTVGEQNSITAQSGKPLNLKEFLARELLKRSQSSSASSNDDSTLASQFLRSLLGTSDSSTQQNVLKHVTQRTSTPVKPLSTLSGTVGGTDDPTKSPPTNYLFSGESGISSVRASTMSTSGKETSKSSSGANDTGDKATIN